MTRPSLEADLVLNGDKSVRVYEEKGIIFPSKPVPRFIEFSIYNIQEKVVKEVHLYDFIGMDLIARSLTADIASDDDKPMSDKGSQPNPHWVESVVEVVEHDIVVDRLNFYFTSFPAYVNHIVIDHQKTWRIKCNDAVNKLTFYCEPIFIDSQINVP